MNKQLETLYRLAQDTESCANAKIAAAIYVKNRLVGIGWNQQRTDPTMLRWQKNEDSIYIHAEIAAVKQALRFYSEKEFSELKTTLYVARAKRPSSFSKEWITGCAMPCVGCSAMIKELKIKRVIFTEDGEPGTFPFTIQLKNY